MKPPDLLNRKQDNYMLLKIWNNFKNTEAIFFETAEKNDTWKRSKKDCRSSIKN